MTTYPVQKLSDAQLANAAGLYAITMMFGAINGTPFPDRVPLAVITCAFDEGSLINQVGGDQPGFMCFFQQSNDYGTPQIRMDPAPATSAFLYGGPAGQPGFLTQPYMSGSLDDVARCIQAVQGSGTPDASNYMKAMPTAQDALTRVKAAFYGPVGRQLAAVVTDVATALRAVTDAAAHDSAIDRFTTLDLRGKAS